MHRLCVFCLAAAVLILPLRGGDAREPAAFDSEIILHILTWEDYFDSNVINEFQKRHNCSVVVDTYESNGEILPILQQIKSGYDIVTPSTPITAALHREGMLLPLDHAKIPNIKYISDAGRTHGSDPEFSFSIPYTMTVTGIGYNKALVPASVLDGWNTLASPVIARRGALFDDHREVLGAALKNLGFSLNTTNNEEIRQAAVLVETWMKNLSLLGVNKTIEDLKSGELLVALAYNGDIANAIPEFPDLGFYVPPEGAPLNADHFVIPVGTPYPDLAHAFINHMHDPEMAKQNMKTIKYFMPNVAANELRASGDEYNFSEIHDVPPEILEKCESIADLGPDDDKYLAAWKKIKATARR